MTVENPGSLNEFSATHPEIPEDKTIKEYSDRLATFHAGLNPVVTIMLTPERLELQKFLTQKSVEGVEAA